MFGGLVGWAALIYRGALPSPRTLLFTVRHHTIVYQTTNTLPVSDPHIYWMAANPEVYGVVICDNTLFTIFRVNKRV